MKSVLIKCKIKGNQQMIQFKIYTLYHRLLTQFEIVQLSTFLCTDHSKLIIQYYHILIPDHFALRHLNLKLKHPKQKKLKDNNGT